MGPFGTHIFRSDPDSDADSELNSKLMFRKTQFARHDVGCTGLSQSCDCGGGLTSLFNWVSVCVWDFLVPCVNLTTRKYLAFEYEFYECDSLWKLSLYRSESQSQNLTSYYHASRKKRASVVIKSLLNHPCSSLREQRNNTMLNSYISSDLTYSQTVKS